jgi:hypothetical protein
MRLPRHRRLSGQLARPLEGGWDLLRILAIAFVLLRVSGASGQSGYLPLAVGNSWTFAHIFDETRSEVEGGEAYAQVEVTIEVLSASVVDGVEYFRLSSAPYDWPPLPLFFPSGGLLRWRDDGSLEMLGAGGVRTALRFSAIPAVYSSEETGVSIEVRGNAASSRWPRESVEFRSRDMLPDQGRSCISFAPDYGFTLAGDALATSDHLVYENTLTPLRAVIDGRSVSYTGVTESAVAPVSWADVKAGKKPAPTNR